MQVEYFQVFLDQPISITGRPTLFIEGNITKNSEFTRRCQLLSPELPNEQQIEDRAITQATTGAFLDPVLRLVVYRVRRLTNNDPIHVDKKAALFKQKKRIIFRDNKLVIIPDGQDKWDREPGESTLYTLATNSVGLGHIEGGKFVLESIVVRRRHDNKELLGIGSNDPSNLVLR